MKDPRTYIKPVPLPAPPTTGLKIQARSEHVFNPTLPTRDDVRKDHYQRRLVQMTQQGFRSLIHKPYQGIGDPFYLDQKKLILHALGQWEEVSDRYEVTTGHLRSGEPHRTKHRTHAGLPEVGCSMGTGNSQLQVYTILYDFEWRKPV